jgi:hypothetical protein
MNTEMAGQLQAEFLTVTQRASTAMMAVNSRMEQRINADGRL